MNIVFCTNACRGTACITLGSASCILNALYIHGKSSLQQLEMKSECVKWCLWCSGIKVNSYKYIVCCRQHLRTGDSKQCAYVVLAQPQTVQTPYGVYTVYGTTGELACFCRPRLALMPWDIQLCNGEVPYMLTQWSLFGMLTQGPVYKIQDLTAYGESILGADSAYYIYVEVYVVRIQHTSIQLVHKLYCICIRP